MNLNFNKNYTANSLSNGEKVLSEQRISNWYWLEWGIGKLWGIVFTIIFALTINFAANKAITDGIIENNYTFISVFGIWIFFTLWGLINHLIYRYCREHTMTNKKLSVKEGWVGTYTNELYANRVETITLEQGVLGKIFNYGDISFTGIGEEEVWFTYVDNAKEVKTQLENFLKEHKGE